MKLLGWCDLRDSCYGGNDDSILREDLTPATRMRLPLLGASTRTASAVFVHGTNEPQLIVPLSFMLSQFSRHHDALPLSHEEHPSVFIACLETSSSSDPSRTLELLTTPHNSWSHVPTIASNRGVDTLRRVVLRTKPQRRLTDHLVCEADIGHCNVSGLG